MAALFAAALIATLFSSCAKQGSQTTNPTAGGANTPGEDKYHTVDANGDVQWKVQVEPFDWGGRTFNVLVRKDDADGLYHDVDFTYDQAKQGEPINDAAWRRSTEIETMFNIKINPILMDAAAYQDQHLPKIRASVQADDKAFDIAFNTPRSNGVMAREGLLYNLADFPNIDLSEPWWDQNFVKSSSIGNKIYQCGGDISTGWKYTATAMFFNKQMIADLGLESPYTLIENNQWTFDKLTEMSKAVYTQMNTTGDYNVNNVIGIAGYDGVLGQALSASGVYVIQKDADDIPQLSFYNDKTVEIFQKLTSTLYDKTLLYDWQAPSVVSAGGVSGQKKFINNQLLFLWNEMYNAIQLRQMDTDFGIIPSPKYDSSQDRYYMQINNQQACVLTIPKYSNQDELPKIGAVVSALATLGKNYLTPAFYDITLKGKVTRDAESEKYLDLIYNNIMIDQGRMYDTGKVASGINTLMQGSKTDLASWWASMQTAAQTDLDKMVSDYENNND